MEEYSTTEEEQHFTARASLAALGMKLRSLDVFGPIRARVKIAQKTVRHTPIEKLYDAFIAILAGAHGLVEINTRVRSDAVLQQAFGRSACAEQSVVQETLDACTSENVQQMEAALDEIYRTHSRGYAHDYEARLQLLDVDLSGLPCGRKAAFATKGYFAKQRNRRGRQLGRVLASHYDEIVVDRLFAGHTQLTGALRPLMEAAAQTLALQAAERTRTLVRIDAGGGTVEHLNWLLQQGYQILAKDYSTTRATKLAQQVADWVEDPQVKGRQVGIVPVALHPYRQPVQRVAVRCRRKDDTWAVGVLVTTVSLAQAQSLVATLPPDLSAAQAGCLPFVYLYDQRGGAAETAFKGDKQGLGLTKRNKKRWEAQQMVMLLGALAHNVTVWSRVWLAPQYPQVARYGTLRLVRDLFQVSGFVVSDQLGRMVRVVLNQASPLAAGLVIALSPLLAPLQVAVILGQI